MSTNFCFPLIVSHRLYISLPYFRTSSCLPCSLIMCSFLEPRRVSCTFWHLSGANCLKLRWDMINKRIILKNRLHIDRRQLIPTYYGLNQIVISYCRDCYISQLTCLYIGDSWEFKKNIKKEERRGFYLVLDRSMFSKSQNCKSKEGKRLLLQWTQ